MLKLDAAETDFWGKLANEKLLWDKPFSRVLSSDPEPNYSWFEEGKLNASVQCIDQHLDKHAQDTAVIWEAEDGEIIRFTYRELSENVNRLANALKKDLGVKRGDRVVLYLPMIPEAVFSMLACARLGAIHVVVFGGFSAAALRERIIDTGAKLIITADGAFRHGKPYYLKPAVDSATDDLPNIKRLIVRRNNGDISLKEGVDFLYEDLVATQSTSCKPESMNSEDPLFVLHTSGSTGKPKGIIHSTAGYLLGAHYTSELSLQLTRKSILWCTADVGWITGHTYTVYGPLSVGATIVIYEGTIDYPNENRWWSIIEKHKVSMLYTAPTAIRTLMKLCTDCPKDYNLSSLSLLGTVGEPINPTAWAWYHEQVGGGRCRIIDTWWQTETGCHLIAPILPTSAQRPGVAASSLPGISVNIVDEAGDSVRPHEKGLLCITKPWPSMLRGVWGNPERFQSYFDAITIKGESAYFSGDAAYRDEDGDIVITGRIDDVINTSGHRLGTAELESAIAKHPSIAEVAVVGKTHHLKGEVVVAFAVPHVSHEIKHNEVHSDINKSLKKTIGGIASVDHLVFVPELPKTRSGKILRRTLRSIVNQELINSDLSTIEKPDIVPAIALLYSESKRLSVETKP